MTTSESPYSEYDQHHQLSYLERWLIRSKLQRRRFADNWALFRQYPFGIAGLVIIALFGLMAILHPILIDTVWPRNRFDPFIGYDQDYAPHPSKPSWDHPFGTDTFGRDVLSRLIYGARVSFGVGILAAVIAVTLSTVLGGAAGYFGGIADTIMMGISDVFVLMPAPVVLLIFGLLFPLQWPLVGIAYGILTGLGGQAIIVKSQTLSIKVKSYIEVARIAGGGDIHIIRKHILPGLIPLAIVHGVFTVVGAVLTESLLSFFSRTTIQLSWGSMIWLGQLTFRWFKIDGQWHAILPPAIALMLFCSSFYIVGRALDDIVNPKLRKL
jgi:peptide/nickel transport system permease protein